ncbi:MAG: hypothetical protein PUF10_10270 [Bacteroidales bacterium]|nr:hypothetical protein [Bacteroidales bacterium]
MYKIVFDEMVSILNDSTWNEPILAIHIPQRAKFERYLQAVLSLRLKKRFDDTEIEYPLDGKHVDIYANETCIELKTPNTSYKFSDIVDKTRPITKNVQSITDDINKLRTLKIKEGVVAFVMFPIHTDKDDYMKHINKIISALGNDNYCQEIVGNMLVFSCKI